MSDAYTLTARAAEPLDGGGGAAPTTTTVKIPAPTIYGPPPAAGDRRAPTA